MSNSTEGMTPVQAVLARFHLPFNPYEFQENDINALAPLKASGLYYDPGLGKTSTATICALYKFLTGEINTVIVCVPPIIIPNWVKYLRSIKPKNGAEIKVVAFNGTPKQRKETVIEDAHFIVMSLDIFKRDNDSISHRLHKRKVHVIVDEAHALKDVGTANYKTVRDFAAERTLQILTGTPINKLEDVYAYTKLIAPHLYRNLNHFNSMHVEELDFYKKPSKYCNEDILQANFRVNARRATKEEVLKDLPPCTIQTMEYELSPAHYKLYKTLVEQKLLEYDDGTKLDMTQANSLFHALGQVVMNYGHFANDPSLRSMGIDLIEQVLNELGDKKLIVFANYKMTNRLIREHFGCPAIFSDITNKQRELDRFIEDPKCRLITMQPVAGGVGVDGLQHICQDILYVEPPVTPSHLTQSLSRVHRQGQREAVTVRLGLAIGTEQAYRVKQLSNKEAQIAPIQGSKAVLKAALLGQV